MRKVNRQKKIRVSAGKFKGRYLFSAKVEGLRPTAVKVRESLFNIIGCDIENACFFDLFAGTGSVGIEALSRGAGFSFFVEKNRETSKLLLKNLDHLLIDESTSSVYTGSAESFCLNLAAPEGEAAMDKILQYPFKIIFFDPPYATELLENIIQLLKNISFPGIGILVFEHSAKKEIVIPDDIDLFKKSGYKYGDTMLTVCWC